MIGGAFNQWAAESAVVEFPDISEVLVGPTRGYRAIDRIFTNMGRSLGSSGTVPPLETDNSTSDHRIVYASFSLPRHQTFEWVTYSYRLLTEEAKQDFGRWIVQQHWEEVLAAAGPDSKVDLFQETIDAAMDVFFPIRTVRRKSTDPPWMTKKILKRIRRRMHIYIKEGRSELCHYMKRGTDELIKTSKEKYMAIKKDQLTAADANRSFFRLVKAFNTPEKPQNFDVRALRQGSTGSEVAEELADFFNRISSEFEPLTGDLNGQAKK